MTHLKWWKFHLKKVINPLLNDKSFIKFAYWLLMGQRINLDRPQLYQEKLNWLKLYYRNPSLSPLVDKYLVKEYIEKSIGGEYVVKTLGVWDCFDDIDFGKLPNKFVLKCTHDSASYVIVYDKLTMDKSKAKKRLDSHLRRSFYWVNREWPYKNCQPRIMAEELLDNGGKPLTDYKFFCFDGEPKFMYVSADTDQNARTDFFDMNYNHLDMRMKDLNSDTLPSKPEKFEEMKELARKLCKGFPHVRVDFYLVNHQIYFGELTFFHNGGFQKIYPEKWNRILGDWITLPEKVNPYNA